jgi:hypothetical protein
MRVRAASGGLYGHFVARVRVVSATGGRQFAESDYAAPLGNSKPLR